jgi:hypothetical protein
MLNIIGNVDYVKKEIYATHQPMYPLKLYKITFDENTLHPKSTMLTVKIGLEER